MLRWLILSLLLTPLFDARAAGDEAAVRATFAAYKAAVLAQQGERAADNVTTGTSSETVTLTVPCAVSPSMSVATTLTEPSSARSSPSAV